MFGRATIRLGIGPHSSFCLVSCGRLSSLFVSFGTHVNIVYRIVSCIRAHLHLFVEQGGLVVTDQCVGCYDKITT